MKTRLRSRLIYMTFVMILVVMEAHAQNHQQEINDQVWKPFILTFNQFETEKFMALHAKDVVRSSRDANQVLNWQQYHDQQKKGDDWSKGNGYTRTLELRFIERLASPDQAIETGSTKRRASTTKARQVPVTGNLWWCYAKKTERGKFLSIPIRRKVTALARNSFSMQNRWSNLNLSQ